MRTRWTSALGFSWLLAAPLGAGAEIAVGDVFVSESATGSVANARGGGDLSGAPRFATGLEAPSGLCVTQDGRLLAAESASGQVTDVTEGGDFAGAEPFASGLDTPRDLLCGDDVVLAVEAGPNGEGEITDITAGGDFSAAAPFATGLGAGATALLRAGESEPLFASDAGLGRIFDASAGGSVGAPFATNGAGTAGLAAFAGKRLAANPGTGQILDFGAGGDLAAQPVFATLPGVVALLPVEGLGLLAASGTGGTLHDASAGGDLAAAAPFASGLAVDAAFAGLARVAGCGDGVLDAEEEQCDDGNTEDGDGCDSRCRIRLCLIPAATGCIEATEGKLSIRQKGEGDKSRGKFAVELGAFAEDVEALDFGNPVFDTTRFDLCVYGASDDLVGQLIVDRGFGLCGPKDETCWKPLDDRGYRYKDKERLAGGIGEMLLLAGPAGDGEIRVGAKRTKKSQRLPRMTQALAGGTQAEIRLMSSHGRCVAATLDDVKRADEGRFVGSAP